MPITRLALDAYGARRVGSFVGKAASGGGLHPVGILSRLSIDAYGVRRAGSFVGKSSVLGTCDYNSDIYYNANFDYNASSCSETDNIGRAGHPVYYKHVHRKRKRFDTELKEWIDKTARELYGDLTDKDVLKSVKAEAASIVRPFVETSVKSKIPQARSVDWKALEQDIYQYNALLSLWYLYIYNQDILDDDDEIIMMDS